MQLLPCQVCVGVVVLPMHDTPGSTAQSVAFTIVLSDSLLHKKIITLILMRIISNINTNGWGASMDACKRAMYEACVHILRNLLGLRTGAPIAPRPPPPPPPRPRPPPGGLRPPPGGLRPPPGGLRPPPGGFFPLPFAFALRPPHFEAAGRITGSTARAPIALQPAAPGLPAW